MRGKELVKTLLRPLDSFSHIRYYRPMNLRSQYELDLTVAIAQHVEAMVRVNRANPGHVASTVTVSPLEQVKCLVQAADRMLTTFDAAGHRQYDLVLDLASKIGRNDQFGADPNGTPEA